MNQNRKSLNRSESGQSLVEFALVLPMLLVVMFMITEFGRALYQYNILAQATREGARRAVVSSEGVAESVGEERMDSLLTKANLDLNTVATDVEILSNYGGSNRKVVRVSASKSFDWILSGPVPVNPQGSQTVSPAGGLILRAETVMQGEAF
jgi:Flp pilus assembly protein TadG